MTTQNHVLSAHSPIPLSAGRIGIAIAITAVISVVTLGLLYAGIPFFGPVNDLTNAVGGLLSALLAWQFHKLFRTRAPGSATIFLTIAWVGSGAIIINSILVAAGLMGWMTGGMYTAIGLGLQGIWLLAFLRLASPQPLLTPGLIRLGAVTGIGSLFGLSAGPLLAAGTSPTESPLVLLSYVGAAVGWLLYPVWCWLVGRRLLSG